MENERHCFRSEQIPRRLQESAILSSSDQGSKVTFLCDSGANVHMTPWLTDLEAPRSVNRSCTFGNKGQLRAPAQGEILLHNVEHSKGPPLTITLKDVLRVPGLPCRLLSTGAIRRDGGEYFDSSSQTSYILIKHGGLKISLEEKKGFLRSGTRRSNIRTPANIHYRHLSRLAHTQWSLLAVKCQEMSRRYVSIYLIHEGRKKPLGISKDLKDA